MFCLGQKHFNIFANNYTNTFVAIPSQKNTDLICADTKFADFEMIYLQKFENRTPLFCKIDIV